MQDFFLFIDITVQEFTNVPIMRNMVGIMQQDVLQTSNKSNSQTMLNQNILALCIHRNPHANFLFF